VNAALHDNAKKIARLDESAQKVVITAPMPPGRVVVQAFYELPFDGETLDFRQLLPIETTRMAFAVENAPGVTIGGPSFQSQELRDHAGTQTLVFALAPSRSGQPVEFTIYNLPHRDKRLKLAAVGLTGIIVLWALVALFSERSHHTKVRQQRESLLDRIVALDQRKAGGDINSAQHRRDRNALLAQLRQIWKASGP
jgi:hypothetical protein